MNKELYNIIRKAVYIYRKKKSFSEIGEVNQSLREKSSKFFEQHQGKFILCRSSLSNCCSVYKIDDMFIRIDYRSPFPTVDIYTIRLEGKLLCILSLMMDIEIDYLEKMVILFNTTEEAELYCELNNIKINITSIA